MLNEAYLHPSGGWNRQTGNLRAITRRAAGSGLTGGCRQAVSRRDK